MVANPFILNGYAGDKYFCDREKETRTLIELIENGNNVVISAPRRIGKTDLISHVFEQPEIKGIYIPINVDIYATQSLDDFVEFLGKAIIKALKPRGKAIVDGFINALKSLHSQISFDINGMPVWGIGMGQGVSPEITLEEIFAYLQNSDRPCLVAIDEFQQITQYKTPWKVEALLRTYIQKCSFTRFIFSGSHRHLMAEIFTSPSRPFYASVAFLSLDKIDCNIYAEFCQTLFNEYDKTITRETVEEVYNTFDGVTAYLQRTMNMLFASTPKGTECTKDMVMPAIDSIINGTSDTYAALYNQLTQRQRQVMKAIAAAGEARNIQSEAFLKKYALGTASSVSSAAKTLLDKDLLTHTDNVYAVYDAFFRLWILRQFP